MFIGKDPPWRMCHDGVNLDRHYRFGDDGLWLKKPASTVMTSERHRAEVCFPDLGLERFSSFKTRKRRWRDRRHCGHLALNVFSLSATSAPSQAPLEIPRPRFQKYALRAKSIHPELRTELFDHR